MRNLAEYPMTRQEIVECLDRLGREFAAELRCGDMRPVLLEAAARLIEKGGRPDEVVE